MKQLKDINKCFKIVTRCYIYPYADKKNIYLHGKYIHLKQIFLFECGPE